MNCSGSNRFADDVDSPWEWKGPVARSGKCVYGKFFGGKAGFISLEWVPDFANYRRDGYAFDARYDDGFASRKDKGVYGTIAEHGALLSKELKVICNYRKGGNKGFAGCSRTSNIETDKVRNYVAVNCLSVLQYGRIYCGILSACNPSDF